MNTFEHIPANWDEMSHNEKDLWFARTSINYTREGEISGVREEVPDDVKAAYAAFIKDEGNE